MLSKILNSKQIGRVELSSSINKELHKKDSMLNKGLISAVKSNDALLARAYIFLGASINSTDEKGHTAIFFARSKKMFNILKAQNADLNYTNEKGDTPLLYSVVSKNLNLTNQLLNSNISYSKDVLEKALELSYKLNDFEIIKTLCRKLSCQYEKVKGDKNNKSFELKEEPKIKSLDKLLPYDNMLNNPEKFLMEKICNNNEKDKYVDLLRKMTYLENPDDKDFVKKVFTELLDSKDERIIILTKYIASTFHNNQIKIFIGSHTKGHDVSRLYRYQDERIDSGNRGNFHSGKRYLFLSIPLKCSGIPQKSMFKRIMLHEFSHVAFGDLYKNTPKELSRISACTFKNIKNTKREELESLDEIKASKFFDWDVLYRINSSYSNKKDKEEELLCDAFRVFDYNEKHPERKLDKLEQVKPILAFVNKDFIPNINRTLQSVGVVLFPH